MGSLKLNNVHKSFGKVDVIKGVNLEVNDGEFIIFVGPSGCGKSTLLRIIAGLEDATSGEILIDDKRVNEDAPSDRGIAMVFQSYALYPHLSVRDNMSLGLKQAKRSKEVIKERVDLASNMLSLSNYMDRHPAELSGGQRQRVAIGRAIVRQPELFLFDEPLSNLDAALRVQTRLEIASLHHKLKATMIYVTHDQVEAMTLADRIVVLHDGIVEQIGSPMELYNNPNNLFVAGFIGSPKMNLIPAKDLGIEGCKTIGIRPEHIKIEANAQDSSKLQWAGIVQHVEHLGSDTNVFIRSPNAGDISVRLFGEHQFNVEDQVYITPDPERIFRFDDDGQRSS